MKARPASLLLSSFGQAYFLLTLFSCCPIRSILSFKFCSKTLGSYRPVLSFRFCGNNLLLFRLSPHRSPDEGDRSIGASQRAFGRLRARRMSGHRLGEVGHRQSDRHEMHVPQFRIRSAPQRRGRLRPGDATSAGAALGGRGWIAHRCGGLRRKGRCLSRKC